MDVNLTVTNSHFPCGKMCNIQLDGLRRIIQGSKNSSDGAGKMTQLPVTAYGAFNSSGLLYRISGKEISTGMDE